MMIVVVPFVEVVELQAVQQQVAGTGWCRCLRAVGAACKLSSHSNAELSVAVTPSVAVGLSECRTGQAGNTGQVGLLDGA